MKEFHILQTYARCQNFAATARECKVNEKTVRLWVKREKETGGVAVKPGKGRKKALSKEAVELAHAMMKSRKYAGAERIAEELRRRGYTSGAKAVSKATVIRHVTAYAKSIGRPIYAARGKPRKQMTVDTMRKRLLFCEENSTRQWDNVAFSDRKKFLWFHPHTSVSPCVWLERGEQHVAYSPNHPSKVNVYAAITKYGITPLHFVTGTDKMQSTFKTKAGAVAKNITTHEYQVVLDETLIPACGKLFEDHGVKEWVFQQDNDPTHKIPAPLAIGKWNASHPTLHATLLPNWPPNSPDLNLIENVWAWAQAKVNAIACHTFEEFKEAVTKTLREVPKEMLNNLYNSMHNRLQQCIEKEGGKTKY